MKLNESQQRVINGNGHMVVAAPPGSGKTRVLVERTKRLLEQSSGRIYLVTFTRNAAKEMQDRIGQMGHGRVKAATFDSYCLSMSRRAGNKVGPPNALQDWLAKKRLAEELGSGDIEDIDARIMSVATKLSIGSGNSHDANLYKRYIEYLDQDSVRDFASIARGVVKQMNSNGKIKPLPARYLLVDEFQDADEIQLAWVIAHARAGATVMVVGDDDQAIYGWRGGMGFHAMKAIEKQLGAEVVMLDTCYRCRPELVESARLLISHNKNRFNKATRSPRPVGAEVKWWSVANEDAGIYIITEKLKRLGWPKFAVLARRNADLDKIERQLTSAGKDVRRIGGKSFWANIGAIAALNLAEYVANPNDRKPLKTVLEWMHVPEVERNVIFETLDLGMIDGKAGEITNGPGRDLALMLLKAQERIEKSKDLQKNVSDMFNFIFDHERQPWRRIKSAKSAIEFIEEKTKDTGQPLSKVVSNIKSSVAKSKKENNAEADGALATMHGAKGMEWPVVFIIGANEGVMPNTRGENDDAVPLETIEEERRLFFVALTRAEDRCFPVAYQSAVPSRFIAEARIEQADLVSELKKCGVKTTQNQRKNLGIEGQQDMGERKKKRRKKKKNPDSKKPTDGKRKPSVLERLGFV